MLSVENKFINKYQYIRLDIHTILHIILYTFCTQARILVIPGVPQYRTVSIVWDEYYGQYQGTLTEDIQALQPLQSATLLLFWEGSVQMECIASGSS